MIDVQDYLQLIERIAKHVSRDYPDIDWQDTNNEIVVFCLENKNSIKSKEEGGNPAWLFRRIAHMYCNNERAKQLSTSVQYSYRLSDVKKILEHAFLDEKRERVRAPEDSPSFDGEDKMLVSSDIRDAFRRLSDEHKQALWERYYELKIPPNASYERKKLNLATKELTRILNSYRGKGPFVGTRKTIRNTAAQAIISNDW